MIKVLKFGGQSLSNGQDLQRCLSIIKQMSSDGSEYVVVVSARGKTTDQLLELMNRAKNNYSIEQQWLAFKEEQIAPLPSIDFTEEFKALRDLLRGIELLKEYSDKIEAKVLAYGELFSAQIVAALLNQDKVDAQFVDSRKLIITDSNYLNALPLEDTSEEQCQKVLKPILQNRFIPVVTGFIGSDLRGDTTTLGRNGSNYTASLIAKFLRADKVENFTNVNGLYTADPNLIENAHLINDVSYEEVNEMVNFGANILHAKTLIPLIERSIPIEIRNTNAPLSEPGTLISNQANTGKAKSLSVLNNKALLKIEGRGLLGKVGIDERIFSTMQRANVSVGIISQGSSERGIGLVIDEADAHKAVDALKQEFQYDFHTKDMQNISAQKGYTVLSMIGLELDQFAKPFQALINNQVVPVLINNTVTGKNVSILIEEGDTQKAVQIIHAELFEKAKPVYLAIYGTGQVGAALVDQILASKEEIERRKHIKLVIVALANSRSMLLHAKGIDAHWREQLERSTEKPDLTALYDLVEKHHLGHLIFIDNTSNQELVNQYSDIVQHGFDIVSSNKIMNSLPIASYQEFRQELKENHKTYLYETNVGAGLPLIDTIKMLHLSGENITRIRGVFSGTLSYLFDQFSETEQPISGIIQQAIDKGYTEPDPRLDLSGMDVGRKLLILARELDLENNIEDVAIENLIPEALRSLTVDEFLANLTALDAHYNQLKKQ